MLASSLRVSSAYRSAPLRPAAPRGASELVGQTRQQVDRTQPSAIARQLMLHDIAKGKVLEQGDDVRKAFVHRQGIGGGGLHRTPAHSMQDRMGGLMRDNILRQAGENPVAIGCAIFRRASEIAEQQRNLLGTVIGIGFPHGMRIDAQPLGEIRIAPAVLVGGSCRLRSFGGGALVCRCCGLRGLALLFP